MVMMMTEWRRTLKNMKWKRIMTQMKKEKRKSKKNLWMMGVGTPLGVVEDFKMSGEELLLEVHYTQDKTQKKNLGDKVH